jgi:predicted nucleic acid-binding Zn ribbon protein
MIYVYVCEKCDCVIEKDFPFGKPKESVTCECGEKAHRDFANGGFLLKGNGWPGKSLNFGEKQKAKNEKAGKNMRKTWGEPPKLVDQR